MSSYTSSITSKKHCHLVLCQPDGVMLHAHVELHRVVFCAVNDNLASIFYVFVIRHFYLVSVLLSVSTDELAFGLGGEETGVIRLLFLHRLSLLRYVVIVGHSSLLLFMDTNRKISSVILNGGVYIYFYYR